MDEVLENLVLATGNRRQAVADALEEVFDAYSDPDGFQGAGLVLRALRDESVAIRPAKPAATSETTEPPTPGRLELVD